MNGVTAHRLHLTGALEALCSELVQVSEAASIPIAHARGRFLARDVLAALDVPAFDCAAMDGFAVRAQDCAQPSRLRVLGSAAAGHGYAGVLAPATALRIMTGAPLPAGADAVVMREHAQSRGDTVQIDAFVEPGANVRYRGEHLRRGQVVVRAGTLLGAAALGVATAGGAGEVHVFRRLRVGLASTGDELVDAPVSPGPAQSYDGNRPLLAAVCRTAGMETLDLGICGDVASTFAALVARAAEQGLDALLVSGGTARGDADVVRKAASVQFLDLNVWPGRGIVYGGFTTEHGRMALFGLPGSAVATFVMLQLIVLPALIHCAGGVARVPVHLALPLASDMAVKAGRVEYQRARFVALDDGQVAVRPLDQQGAAQLRTLLAADALIAVGPQERYIAGDRVPVVALGSLPG